MSETQKSQARGKQIRKELFGWAKSFAIAFLFAFLIHTFVFTMVDVKGSSMADTLQNEDRLAASIIDLKLVGPSRFDVVIVNYPNVEEFRVKRVIGLPGETIEMKDGLTYIDGEPLSEPFLSYNSRKPYGPYEIPEDCYFVMGDNRDRSSDSREDGVGPIHRDAIKAKARLVCWPFDRFRVIG